MLGQPMRERMSVAFAQRNSSLSDEATGVAGTVGEEILDDVVR